jgi:carboxyl-terminal processing protease
MTPSRSPILVDARDAPGNPETPRRSPIPAVLGAFVALASLLVLLAVGVWWGGHPEDLPSFMRKALVANNSTRVVDEALARIHGDYYRPVGEKQLANASISGAVASLGDRFSHYLAPAELLEFDRPASFSGIGVDVVPDPKGLRIVQVFKSSPAARAGLVPGSVIVAVNGRSLARVPTRVATALIKGRPGTSVTLRVELPSSPGHAHAQTGSSGAPPAGGGSSGGPRLRTVVVTRAVVSVPSIASTTRTVHGVKLGVVALAQFSPGVHLEVREAVEHELRADGARGLVLDLRSNPGGLVEEAQLVASIFLPRGAVVTTMRGRTRPTQTIRALGGAIPAGVKMVVLVDRSTASAAEIVTAALSDHRRAVVVGTHTFGKGVFQEEQPLANGGALDITVGEYFTPDGRNLGGGGVREGAGIAPDVQVRHGVDTPYGLAVALEKLAASIK